MLPLRLAGVPDEAILHADHLGSPRVKADVFSPVIRCRDLYSPFGQKHTAPCDAHRVGFTGKERDGETGFDYFGARFYAPVPGRFLSPDPLLDSADPADPQSWNRYSYVGNNPIRFVDPLGLEKQDATKRTKESIRESLRSFFDGNPAMQMISGVMLDALFPDSNLETALAATGPLGKIGKVGKAGRATGSARQGLPLGFGSAAEFEKFGNSLNAGLRKAGFEDVQALFQGSSVTGRNFKTGVSFDVGRRSDFDIAMVSPELLARAKAIGVSLRSGGNRTGPLSRKQLRTLGLDNIAKELSRQTRRKVRFMVFESVNAATSRAPSIPVPR